MQCVLSAWAITNSSGLFSGSIPQILPVSSATCGCPATTYASDSSPSVPKSISCPSKMPVMYRQAAFASCDRSPSGMYRAYSQEITSDTTAPYAPAAYRVSP